MDPKQMEALMSKHDEFVRFVLSDLKVAAAFFQTFLADKAKDLDLQHLSMASETFIDHNLTKNLTDLFFKVPWRERGQVHISLILEHKSEGAARGRGENLILQMLYQEMQYYKYLLRTQPNKKLPVVLLVGLYHGSQPYTGPRTMADCLEGPPDLIRARWQQEEVVLIDLAELDEQNFEEGRLSIFLRMLKHIYDPDISGCYLSLLPELKKLDQNPSDRTFLIALNNYLLSSAKVENVDAFHELALKSYSEEVGGALMTMAEVLTQRGIEKVDMLNLGIDIPFIASVTRLSAEHIAQLAETP